MIYTHVFDASARLALPPEQARAVPLVTVCNLDREPVGRVDVRFLDYHQEISQWVVVVSNGEDAFLYLYGPFSSERAAGEWGRLNVYEGNSWTVAPIGSPDFRG